MHPLSTINRQFASFSVKKIVIDMGCAYGNTTITALKAGAEKVIACDMEIQHLEQVKIQAENENLASHLEIVQGIFPNDYEFTHNTIDAFHASHIFEFLNGNAVETALNKIFSWLKPNGKLFMLTYTIFVKELDNLIFRKEDGIKWPGFFENYNNYCTEIDEISNDDNDHIEMGETDDFIEEIDSNFHMFELDIVKHALEKVGFMIQKINYLDGKTNAAMKETWLNGRELLGLVAYKP